MSIPVSQLQPKLMILSKTTPLGNVQSTKDHALILKYTRALTRGADFFQSVRGHRGAADFFQSVRGHHGRQNSRHIADYSTNIDAGTTGGHHLGGPGPPGPAPGPPREPCSARGAPVHRAVPQRTRARSQTRLTPPCCRRRRRRGRRTRHAHAPDLHAAGRALSGRSGAHAAAFVCPAGTRAVGTSRFLRARARRDRGAAIRIAHEQARSRGFGM